MKTFAPLLCCALLLTLTSLAANAAVIGHSVLPAASQANILATASKPNKVTAYRDLGLAPAMLPVHLAIVLHYRHEAELRTMAQQRHTNLFGQRALTKSQFLNYFAPSASTYSSTVATLQRSGFKIVHLYANRTVIDVEAPALVVDRFFNTQIHQVQQLPSLGQRGTAAIRGGVRYANVTPAYLPSTLRANVYGVIGFDNMQHLVPQYVRGTRRLARMQSLTATKSPLQGPDTGLGPRAFQTAYNYPIRHSPKGTKYNGTGVGVAVVIDSDYADSDLSTFLSYFGVTRTGPETTRIPIMGGPNPAINGDGVETNLDVETIVGTSPGVSLYLYLPDSLSYASIIDAYNQIDTDDIVEAVNSSFGGCEIFTDPSYFPTLSDFLAEQGAVLGITYSASTGDLGSDTCFTSTPSVSTPASGPDFVAVGGTTLLLHSTGTYSHEFAWSGSGGGQSAIFPLPIYQQGFPGITGTFRNLPDIAFDGDPSSGASEYLGGAWIGPVGGTSLASPLFVSAIAQLNQLAGLPIGNAHTSLYGINFQDGYTFKGLPLFRDIVAGNNDEFGVGCCTAVKGYDMVTGIGSLNVWNFSQAAGL